MRSVRTGARRIERERERERAGERERERKRERERERERGKVRHYIYVMYICNYIYILTSIYRSHTRLRLVSIYIVGGREREREISHPSSVCISYATGSSS